MLTTPSGPFGEVQESRKSGKFFTRAVLCAGAMLIGNLLAEDAVAQSAPSLAGCPVFPADNVWNTPVDHLPVDGNSSTYIATIGPNTGVHPDFGAAIWEGGPIGIPYTLVPGDQPRVRVAFEYADESDPGPYPIPPDAAIEGGSNSTGDRHVLVLDRQTCLLYETYSSYPQPDGSWEAGSGAIFDLRSHGLRPSGWTSADAAGLPILPGLVRYDEVAAGEIRHALRFTAPKTQKKFVWPARHYASSLTASNYPPMGKRFRLKASFDLSQFSSEVQVILRALKKYGMILADNGSAWYISGVPDPQWNDDVLVSELRRVKGSAFEAVDETPLIIDVASGQAKQSPVSPPSSAIWSIGIFRNGQWYLDTNGDGIFDNCAGDKCAQWGDSGDLPVIGEWSGNGKAKIGIFRPANGTWYLDTNGDGIFDNCVLDKCIPWGGSTDIPVVGDWNGDGMTKIGIFRPANGTWYLDGDGNGHLDCSVDKCISWGGVGDTPVVGDWNGDGKTKIGIFRPANGTWYLDANGDGLFDYCVLDKCIPWGGSADVPMVGNWNGDGKTKIGIFRPSNGTWYLDTNGDGLFDNCTVDKCIPWGGSTDVPVVGDWNGDGRTKIGIFRPSNGTWYLDTNGDGLFDNCTVDKCIPWGGSGDRAVVGRW